MVLAEGEMEQQQQGLLLEMDWLTQVEAVVDKEELLVLIQPCKAATAAPALSL